jgi:hypothetical protein
MKQLTLFAIVVLSLSYCTTIKKTFSKQKSQVDSAVNKTSAQINVSKKDSTGAGEIQTTQNKASDSAYKRVTVVKEIFSDEMNLDGEGHDSYSPASGYFDIRKTPVTPDDYLPFIPGKVNSNLKKQVKKLPGELLYRETTITEEGKLVTAEQVKQEVSSRTTVNTSDSGSIKKTENIQVTKTDKKEEREINKTRVLNGIVVCLFFLALVAVSYKIYKSNI